MRTKLTGVTVIELLLVLAVIAAVLLGSTKLYQIVDNNRKVNDAVDMILAVYQAGGQYDTLPVNADNMIPTFVDQGYLTSDFEQDSANPWGGSVKATTPSANQLSVTLSNVPAELCSNLGAKFKKMNNAQATPCDAEKTAQDFKVTFNMDYTTTMP